MNYKITQNNIQRLSDNAFIPLDKGNTDYRDYLAWIAAGGVPVPADLPNPNDAVNAQIAQIETSTQVPRIVREALLRSEERAAAQDATPTNTAVMILAANYGYQKVLAVDNKVRVLRAQLK